MRMVTEKFRPNYFFHSITAVRAHWLQAHNIKTVCIDIDNTITAHDSLDVTAEIVAWASSLREGGITLYLVSNNNEERVIPIARRLDIEYIARAGKPGTGKVLSKLGKRCANAAFIGDQLFTDILCGKQCGMTTILVDPVSEEKLIQIKIKRKFEHLISKNWDKIWRDEEDV